MSGRIVSGLCLIALLPAIAACGGTSTSTTDTTETVATTSTTETTPPETTSLRVYLLKDGKVQPVAREVPKTKAVANAVFAQLLIGPTSTEKQLGLTSAVPRLTAWTLPGIVNGVMRFEPPRPLGRRALAQIVYTLTQFPTVKAVELGGKRYTRADFEDETPIILVESPLPYETAGNPIHATGTANTFEATFQYDVVDPDVNVVDTHFVTATSGSGQRGTFDFTTRPFTVSHPGLGALVVYELSAKDGSRIHETKIPLQMTQSG